MKHKHAELIKAWADGAIIQYKVGDDRWLDSHDNDPSWVIESEYRIKPETKIEVRYFQRVTSYKATAFNASAAHAECFKYIEFEPDLEKWDLKITYQDGKEIKVEIAS